MVIWNKIKPINLEVILKEELSNVQPLVITNKDKKLCMKPKNQEDGEFSSCYANTETQKNSLTLKSWFEFLVEITPESITFKPPNGREVHITSHTHQAPELCDKGNFEIIKLETPMLIRCKEETKFVMAPSPFAMIDMYIPSGYIVFDMQFATNLFFYYPRNIYRKLRIDFGQPLVHFYPMEDRRVKLKYIYDDDLFDKVRKARGVFVNRHWIHKQRKLGIKPWWPMLK